MLNLLSCAAKPIAIAPADNEFNGILFVKIQIRIGKNKPNKLGGKGLKNGKK